MNSNNSTHNNVKLFPFVIGIVIVLVAAYLFFTQYVFKKSEFDIVDKPNDKIIVMFDKQVSLQIAAHTNSNFNPGFIASAGDHVKKFISSISKIESYARYGVTSTQGRNNLYLKVTFEDGKVLNEISTGTSCSGYSPRVLFKIKMSKGKTTQVFTNGIEKKDMPSAIEYDLGLLIEKTISNDVYNNHDSYFEAEKIQNDFDEAWK